MAAQMPWLPGHLLVRPILQVVEMKRAFSVVELLTITALLCVLAAAGTALIPRPNERAKINLALKNLKLLGTATAMYVGDSDDRMPLAAVLRPQHGQLGTGVVYPFPAAAGSRGIHPSWQSLGRIGMARAQWANAIYPYVGSPTPYYIPGFPIRSTFGDNAIGADAYQITFTFNGDLHRYPQHSMPNPSVVPLYWTGHGRQTSLGGADSQPVLDCGGIKDNCMFNPNRAPSASHQQVYGDTGFGDVLVMEKPASFWVFSNRKMPVLEADGSAKLITANEAVYPRTSSPDTALKAPFSQLDTDGGPGPDPNKPGRSRIAYWNCDANGVSVTQGPSHVVYWCFFRPDRTR